MTCDNIFQHIDFARPVGEALCTLEQSTQDYLSAAGFQPYHVAFNTVLLLLLVIAFIKLTFKGEHLSMSTVGTLAVIIAALILFGIL